MAWHKVYAILYIGKKKGIKMEIKTKEQARQYAIDYQKQASEKDLSYGELLRFQNKLLILAERFNLVEEFKENGII